MSYLIIAAVLTIVASRKGWLSAIENKVNEAFDSDSSSHE